MFLICDFFPLTSWYCSRAEWDERVEDDNGDEASEASDQLLDDFNGEQFKKDKPPTAPSSMVVFYTWMIVAIFISIVAFSMYQSRCKGFRVSALLLISFVSARLGLMIFGLKCYTGLS